MIENMEMFMNVRFVSNGIIIIHSNPTTGFLQEEVFVKHSAFMKRMKELGEQLSPLAVPKENKV